MDKLCDVFHACHSAVFAEMYPLLATELGVLPEAVEQLGVGYDYKYQAWVFAERNAIGDIIGLSYRYENGKKTMAPGLKHHRGLVYPLNQEYGKGVNRYANGRHNWTRIADAGVNCPVCGKPDGCLVSSENPADPQAAICIRPVAKEGAVKDLGDAGYLHILKPGGKVSKGSVLADTDLPILIVEGASDVLAAMSLGYVGVGRPGASAGMELLTQMPLAGREVWIIGENDAGAGREGMEKAYAVVRTMTPAVRRFMPPDGIKDLRAWYNAGLNQEMLREWVNKHAESPTEVDPSIFENGQPTTFARAFAEHDFTVEDGTCVLRPFNSEWFVWARSKYTKLSDRDLRGALYKFLDGKSFIKETAGGKSVQSIPMTRRLIGDVESALDELPSVKVDPPSWLTRTDMPDPRDLIVFKNGLLDVEKYIRGTVCLYPHDPDLFVLDTLPYAFDPDLHSPEAEDYIARIFNGDKETIRLLQQWMGYNLVPDKTQEKIMLFIGPPRSGKGTILAMLTGILGNQWCSSNICNLSEEFGREKMLGKLAVIFGETKSADPRKMSAALETLLSIVGGDRVNVNRKHIKELGNVDLPCRFTLAANEFPEFTDYSRAFLARVNLIVFPNSYTDRMDPRIKPRMEEIAKSGALTNWALKGLKDLRTRDHFIEPVASMKAQREMEEVTAPTVSFVRECCTLSPDTKVPTEELFDTWRNWCGINGHRPGSQHKFGRWLSSSYSGTITHTRQRNDKSLRYYYAGVTLTDAARKRYLS